MKIPRDVMLVLSLLAWSGVLALIYLDESARTNTSRIPTLASLVFAPNAELHARKGVYFQMPGSFGPPLRVGTWRRDIRYIGEMARVDTRVEFEAPDEILRLLRGSVGNMVASELLKVPRATMHATTDLDREQGLLRSVSQINVFGKTYTERRRVFDGKIRVDRTEGGKTTTRTEQHEWSDAEVGFYAVPDIDLEKTWDILILDLKGPQVVRVRAVGTVDYPDGGKTIRAFEVRADDPAFKGLRALYDGRGRVLYEQGILWPFVQLVLKREAPAGPPPPSGSPPIDHGKPAP